MTWAIFDAATGLRLRRCLDAALDRLNGEVQRPNQPQKQGSSRIGQQYRASLDPTFRFVPSDCAIEF